MSYNLLRPNEFVSDEILAAREKARRKASADALASQEYKRSESNPFRSFLDNYIKPAATHAMEGLDTVSQYTGRPLIGALGGVLGEDTDPATGRRAHSSVAGIGLQDYLGGVAEGIRHPQRAANAMQQRTEDYSPWGKALTGAAESPLSYIGPGVVGAAGKAVPGIAASRAGRVGLSLLDQGGGGTVLGGALGSVTAQQGAEAAGLSPGWQTAAGLAGGLVGGVAGGATGIGARRMRLPTPEEVRAAKLGVKAGVTLPAGTQTTTIINPGEHLFHGHPREIVGGVLKETPAGDPIFDMGPGPYTAHNDPMTSDYYTQTRSEATGGVTGHPEEQTGGRGIMDLTPTRPTGHLEWSQPVTDDEFRRINSVLLDNKRPGLPNELRGQDGRRVWGWLKKNSDGMTNNERNAFAQGVLQEAGFNGLREAPEVTMWDPARMLEPHTDFRARNPGVETERFEDPRVTAAYNGGVAPNKTMTEAPLLAAFDGMSQGTKQWLDGFSTDENMLKAIAHSTGGSYNPEEMAYAQKLLDKLTGTASSGMLADELRMIRAAAIGNDIEGLQMYAHAPDFSPHAQQYAKKVLGGFGVEPEQPLAALHAPISPLPKKQIDDWFVVDPEGFHEFFAKPDNMLVHGTAVRNYIKQVMGQMPVKSEAPTGVKPYKGEPGLIPPGSDGTPPPYHAKPSDNMPITQWDRQGGPEAGIASLNKTLGPKNFDQVPFNPEDPMYLGGTTAEKLHALGQQSFDDVPAATWETALSETQQDYLKYAAQELGLPGPGADYDKSLAHAKELYAEDHKVVMMGGGAAGKPYAVPEAYTEGLSLKERLANAGRTIQQALNLGGIKNHPVATPLMRKFEKYVTRLDTQGTLAARVAERAERVLGVDDKGLIPRFGVTMSDLAANYSVYKPKLSAHEQDVLQALKRSMEDFDATLEEFQLPLRKLNPAEQKNFDDALTAGRVPSLAERGHYPITDPEGFYLPRNVYKGGEEVLPTLAGNIPATTPHPYTAGTQTAGIGAGLEYPAPSAAIASFGHDVGERVSKAWLNRQIRNLPQFNAPGSTGTVHMPTMAGQHLPSEITAVINRVLDAHKDTSEFSLLFQALNNALRSAWATGDASHIGLQSLLSIVDSPRIALKLFKAQYDILRDPTVFGEFKVTHDAKAYGVRPTIEDMGRYGVHFADAGNWSELGQGNIGSFGAIGKQVPGVGGLLEKGFKPLDKILTKSNQLYADTGNFNRVWLFDMLYDQYKSGVPIKGLRGGGSEQEALEAIAKAVNRSTGFAEHPLGGNVGQALLFAPRFLQSQLEMVTKAVTSPTSLEGQVAARQLAKLAAFGTVLTYGINEARGKETVFDPRDSNFMRIRDVNGSDISVFGPWDSLLRGLVKTPGDPGYLPRTKLAPVISMAVDLISGENILGEPTRTPGAIARSALLPFSAREATDQPITSTALGALGLKSSPLSDTEVLDNKLSSAGINKSDPEYLIKRRQYLADNPAIQPRADRGDFKRTQEIQGATADRRAQLDQRVRSGEVTLKQFRDIRSDILLEQRSRLDEVLRGKDIKGASSAQRDLLRSYFDTIKSSVDTVTGKPDPDKLDPAIAAWTNEHGSSSLEFVQKYLGAGLSTSESAYFNDLRRLDSAGYFDTPKYQHMRSDLTESDIDHYKSQIIAARSADPSLQSVSTAATARQLFAGELTATELQDVIHAFSDKYASKERAALQAQFRRELQWFNPNATWDSYQSATTTPKVTRRASAVSAPSRPRVALVRRG